MLSSLRWRLSAALLAVLLLGAATMSLLAAAQARNPVELVEERSLASQARDTLRGVRLDARTGAAHVDAQGGWDAAYRRPDAAYFTLFGPDGRPWARSPNLDAPLPDLRIPPGADHSRLELAGPDQVLVQAVRAPGGARLVVGRVNPERRVEAPSDALLEAAPTLTLVAVIALAGLLVVAISGWSLRPLRRAAAEAALIGPLRPEARLSERGMPTEAAPLARAVNAGLDRVADAYEAEKRFTADAAHALRTPLTVLDLRLQHLERGEAVSPERLRADVGELVRIVSGLLQLAQGDRRRTEVRTRTANLARVLREAAAEVAPRLEALGRELDVVAPDTALAPGDAGAWRDGVAALLDNAVVHGAGRVRAELRRVAPGEFALAVEDEGAGVAPEMREAVFDRFHKLDGSTRGAGLGLAIIRQTAERHGGHTRFADRARIEVRVPAAD